MLHEDYDRDYDRVSRMLQDRGLYDGQGEPPGIGRTNFASIILSFIDDLHDAGDPSRIVGVAFDGEGDPHILLDRELTIPGLVERRAEVEAHAGRLCVRCTTRANTRAIFDGELRPACPKHGGAPFFAAGDRDVLCLLTQGGAYLLSDRVGYAKISSSRPDSAVPAQGSHAFFLEGFDGSHRLNLDIKVPVDPGMYRIRGSSVHTTVRPSIVGQSFTGDLVDDLEPGREHVLLTPYETWITEPGDEGEVIGRQWLPVGFSTTPRTVDPYAILNLTPGAGLILRVREKSKQSFAELLTPIEVYAPGWVGFAARIRADVDELCDAAGFPRFTLHIGSFVNLGDDTTSKSASIGPWFAATDLAGPMPKTVEERLYRAYDQAALACSVCGVVGVAPPERLMRVRLDGRLTPVEPEPPAGPVVRKYQLQEIDWDALDGVVSAPRCDEHAPCPEAPRTIIG